MSAPATEEKFTADVILIGETPVGFIDGEIARFAGTPTNETSIEDPEQKLPHIIEHSPEEAYFYSDIKKPIDISLISFYRDRNTKSIILCRLSNKRVELADISLERREIAKILRGHETAGSSRKVQLRPDISIITIERKQNLEFHHQLLMYYARIATGLNLPSAIKQIPRNFTALETYGRLFGLIDHDNSLFHSVVYEKKKSIYLDKIASADCSAAEMDAQIPLESAISDENEIQRIQQRDTLISYHSQTVVAHFDKNENVIRMPQTKKYKIKAKLAIIPPFRLLFRLENGKYCETKFAYQQRSEWLIRCFNQVESRPRLPLKDKIAFYPWKLDGAVWEPLFHEGKKYLIRGLTDLFEPKVSQLSSVYIGSTPITLPQSWSEQKFPNFVYLNPSYRVSLIKRSSLDEYFPDYVIPDIQNLIFEFVCDGFIDDLDNPESSTTKALKKLSDDHIDGRYGEPEDSNPLRDFLLSEVLTKFMTES
jgi:hypothetical protein